MTPDPMDVIADLREKLRQQVHATVSAARTAQLALLRLERQQPLVAAALSYFLLDDEETGPGNTHDILCREASAYRAWLESQS